MYIISLDCCCFVHHAYLHSMRWHVQWNARQRGDQKSRQPAGILSSISEAPVPTTQDRQLDNGPMRSRRHGVKQTLMGVVGRMVSCDNGTVLMNPQVGGQNEKTW